MREVDPKQTKRARAFDLWMEAPMPMVTLFYTLDVSNLRRVSRKHGYKFNMLLCWCIGRAATQMEEFYLLPAGKRLIQYDKLAINTVVAAQDGDIYTCDVAFDPREEDIGAVLARECENVDCVIEAAGTRVT